MNVEIEPETTIGVVHSNLVRLSQALGAFHPIKPKEMELEPIK